MNTYKKYANLLNNEAEQEVAAFLREDHSIEAYKNVSIDRTFFQIEGRFILRVICV